MANILQVPVPVTNAAIVWPARQSSVSSLLFINQDLNNTIWIGQESAVTAAGPNTIPIPPNGTFSGDASSPWYVIGSVAGTRPLVVVPNGQAYFLGLTQGMGNLSIPSVQSPNFVSGSTGWQIRKDGSAEFNSGTFRGTITDAGMFVYSGAPGPGNPPVFAVVTPGTTADPFGNAVKAIMSAGNVSSGNYTTIDASGDLLVQAPGKSVFLNPFLPGIEIFNGTAQPEIIIDASRDAIFVYTAAGGGAGNLIASIASQSGTDGFGNNFNPGIWSYNGNAQSGINQGTVEIVNSAVAGVWEIIRDTSTGNLLIELAASNAFLFITESGFVVPAQPGTTTPETWHTIASLPTGWTALGAGVRYRLMPDDSVRIQVSAQIGSTAASGTVSIFTLPTGYVPANQFRGCAPGIFTGVVTPSGSLLNTRFQVTNTGVVEFLAFPGGSSSGITEVDGQWDVPLD